MNEFHSNNIFNIAYAINDKYVLPVCVSIKSIVDNLECDDRVVIYILYNEKFLCIENRSLIRNLFESNRANIKFLAINDNYYGSQNIPEHYWWSVEIYYKLLLANLIKNVDKILFLDGDTIILSSLKQLFLQNLSLYYAGAVTDANFEQSCTRLKLKEYFNAGVILFNLKKMREDNIEEKFIKNANEYADILVCPEQDILNITLQNQVLLIDSKWNTQQYTLDFIDCNALGVKIFHCSGKLKPWIPSYYYPNKVYFFKYLKKLPFHFQISKYYLPYKNEILKQIRKSFIWYKKAEKSIILFNKFNIHL